MTTLTPRSVRKKLEDKSFAAKVEKSEIAVGVEPLEVDLSEHIQRIIDALELYADELGIEPRSHS